jgi:adenosine deaminase
MTDEIELLVDRLDFDLEQIKKLLLNGFKSAFLRYPERKALIAEANEALGTLS